MRRKVLSEMIDTEAPVSYKPGIVTLPGRRQGTDGRGLAGVEGVKREDTVAAQK